MRGEKSYNLLFLVLLIIGAGFAMSGLTTYTGMAADQPHGNVKGGSLFSGKDTGHLVMNEDSCEATMKKIRVYIKCYPGGACQVVAVGEFKASSYSQETKTIKAKINAEYSYGVPLQPHSEHSEQEYPSGDFKNWITTVSSGFTYQPGYADETITITASVRCENDPDSTLIKELKFKDIKQVASW